MKSLKYTRIDILRRTSEKLNISADELKIILDSILETIGDMLKEPNDRTRIELRNFGVFEIKPTKAKSRARNPKTNEEIYVPAHRKAHFKVGKNIRKILIQEWNEN